jgi:hypothetical protein
MTDTRTQPGNDTLRHAFRAVDELDWKHLLSFIPDSGHGKFWKAVFAETRTALALPVPDATEGRETPDFGFIANDNARQIVCEEWHRAVKEFSLSPGSPTEAVVSRIVDRLDDVSSRTVALPSTVRKNPAPPVSDEVFTEQDESVARAIVRLRELFQAAPYLTGENPIPGCGLVSFDDLKAIQEYAEEKFNAIPAPGSTSREPQS